MTPGTQLQWGPIASPCQQSAVTRPQKSARCCLHTRLSVVMSLCPGVCHLPLSVCPGYVFPFLGSYFLLEEVDSVQKEAEAWGMGRRIILRSEFSVAVQPVEATCSRRLTLPKVELGSNCFSFFLTLIIIYLPPHQAYS